MEDMIGDSEAIEHGKAMLDKIYGAGIVQHSDQHNHSPFIYESLTHLIGKVWDRPHLSIKDRRLITIGITSMIGRQDLLEVQIQGALANKEFSPEQLEEMVVHIAYYAGWGNATSVWNALQATLKNHEPQMDGSKK